MIATGAPQGSPRRVFLDAFRGIPTDRLLWLPDLTWWRDAAVFDGSIDDRYRGEAGFLSLHQDVLALAYYIYATEPGASIDESGASVSVHQIGGAGVPFNGVLSLAYDEVKISTIRDGNLVETTYVCDGRRLKQRKQFLPDSCCYAFLEYPVKGVGEYEALHAIIDQYDFVDSTAEFQRISEAWGDDGVPIAPAPRSPLSALIVDWMGLENFVYAFLEEPAATRELLSHIDQANDTAFHMIKESPAELVHFCDNLSASAYGAYFDELASTYYRKRVEELHAAGKRCVVHLDGSIAGLLGRLSATGVDGVEALTTSPVGDVPCDELRLRSGRDNTVLWGAVPAAFFSESYPVSMLRDAVSRLIDLWDKDRYLIAGSADQVPPNADLGRVRLVGEMIRETWR